MKGSAQKKGDFAKVPSYEEMLKMPTDELLMALEAVLQNHPKEHHQKVIDLFRMLVNQRHSRNRAEKEVNPENV